MSVKETVNDFIQGVKAGKYEVVASTVDTCSGQPEFTFTVNVTKDFELLERLKGAQRTLGKAPTFGQIYVYECVCGFKL